MKKAMYAVIGLALVASATTAFAQTRNVSKIQALANPDGGLRIVISGQNLGTPTQTWSSDKTIYTVEFKANLLKPDGKFFVNKAGVSYVQFITPKKNERVSRVNLKVDKTVKPQLNKLADDWIITIPGQDIVAKTETPKKTPTKKAVVPPTLPFPVDAIPLPTTGASANNKTKTNNVIANANTMNTTISETQNALPKPAPADSLGNARVSLDFVGTDVVQIIKALSIQSSVNIITAPDVSPQDKPKKLTVALNDVSLDDALSFITAMSDLRYARVGRTFIVTPSETFSQAMRQVMERTGNSFDTRVVNILSGEGEKIKEATLKALPQDGRYGFYELIVPNKGDIPGVAVPANEGDNPAKTEPGKKTRVFYLMVVGDPERLDDVEDHIKELDHKITKSTSFSRSADLGTVVVPVQSGETGRIKQMIDRLVAEHPRGAEFSITESILEGTTKGEAQTMALMMFGPKEELARLEDWAKSLDADICEIMGKPFESTVAGLEKLWEVVDLSYAEPSLLELQLKSRFKGLQVSLMPDPVTPNMTGSTSFSDSSQGATGAGNGGLGASGDGGQETSTTTESSEHTITGREPMKLVLRGTRAQIDEAKAFIAMVDIAPKQVALELRVMELTKEQALRVGIDWSALTGGGLVSWRLNQGLGDVSSTSGTISHNTGATNNGESLDFLATLDQMDNGRNILARPNALVTDGRQTNIFVGDTVRYIKSIQSTQNGVTVETDSVNVGVNFDVAARIGGAKSINMNLSQRFSILNGFTPVPGGGNLPQTSDRSSNMFVNMKSGETLAIGGLILEQDRKKLSGIPILKDLPLIGHLFSRVDNSKERTEIVFFLTAVIVDDSNRSMAASPGTSENNVPDPIKQYKDKKAIKGGKEPLN